MLELGSVDLSLGDAVASAGCAAGVGGDTEGAGSALSNEQRRDTRTVRVE